MKSAELAEKNCVPCRAGAPPLTEEEAGRLHDAVPRWSVTDGARRLLRRFEFRDFVQAMEFVNRVAGLAEEQGHHPDISIHWNKVDLVLWTHAIGGLHENDFVLASKIDRLLDEPAGVAG
jgi:4a-hydroxytetrahydrobiopterin dehydratase